MTKEERAEKAASYKNQGICNCCQAVLVVYEDSIDNDSILCLRFIIIRK